MSRPVRPGGGVGRVGRWRTMMTRGDEWVGGGEG